MANYLWIFWAILGAVLVVAEVFTTGFVLLCLASAHSRRSRRIARRTQHYFAVFDLRDRLDLFDGSSARFFKLFFAREERRRSEIRRRVFAG